MSFLSRFWPEKSTEDAPKAPSLPQMEKNNQIFSDFVVYLTSPSRIIFRNLLAGFFKGVGGFLGLTLGVAVMIWALQLIVDFPLFGQYVERLLRVLESSAV